MLILLGEYIKDSATKIAASSGDCYTNHIVKDGRWEYDTLLYINPHDFGAFGASMKGSGIRGHGLVEHKTWLYDWSCTMMTLH
jgi:hypothetical protein